jgi:hypothetical protein
LEEAEAEPKLNGTVDETEKNGHSAGEKNGHSNGNGNKVEDKVAETKVI